MPAILFLMKLRKTLIVDDELEILKAFQFLLSKFEGRVLFAENGKEAIEKLQQNDVGLIISDFKMPNGDGDFLLRFVQSEKRNLEFYFFTSSNVDRYVKEKSVQGIFLKPSDFGSVLSKVRMYLRGHSEVSPPDLN